MLQSKVLVNKNVVSEEIKIASGFPVKIPIGNKIGRVRCGSCIKNNNLYIAGGYNPDVGYLTEFFRVNILNFSLTDLQPIPITSASHYLVSVDDSDDFLYLLSLSGNTYKVYRYSILDDTWTIMADSPAVLNKEGSIAIHNGKIYIIGGKNTNLFYNYDPTTNSWEELADYIGTEYETRHTKLISFGGYIYAIYREEYIDGALFSFPSCYKYDPLTDTWTEISPISWSWYRRRCYQRGYAFVANNLIWYIGMAEQDIMRYGQAFGIMCMAYDPERDKWFWEDKSEGIKMAFNSSVGVFAENDDYVITGFGYGIGGGASYPPQIYRIPKSVFVLEG